MYCNRKCICCVRRIVSTKVEFLGRGGNRRVVITIPPCELNNLDRKCLIIAQNLPAGSGNFPVVISNNDIEIPVLVKTGNKLRADQIRTRKLYRIIYGEDDAHFSLEDYVPHTCYSVRNPESYTDDESEPQQLNKGKNYES